MIKLIVSDLDGTLLDENIKVKQSDIEKIQEALEQGISFCLASGRKDIDIVKVSKMINQSVHRISQNGAFIVLNDETDLHSHYFEPHVAQKIYEHVLGKDVHIMVSTRDDEIVSQTTDHTRKIDNLLFSPIIENQNLHHDIGVSILPSKIVINGEEEVIEALQKELRQRYPDDLDAFISASNTLDIMPKHISKGNAVHKLAEQIGIDLNEIACIGDSFNDIPMFKIAKVSFAMSNARQEVKKEATYEVQSVGEAISKVLEMNAAEK